MSETEPRKEKESVEETDRKKDIVNHHRPDKITKHQVNGQKVAFWSINGIELQISVHTPGIFQLKYLFEGDQRSDFSYAIDPDFNPPKTEFHLSETKSYFQIETNILQCRVIKDDMRVHFLDSNEQFLCKDKQGYYRRDSLMKGIREVKITKEAPDETAYFGLGDKVSDGHLRGHKFENWNTDAYAYERGDDPLYRSIPFYAALTKGKAYGIFLDNTYRSHFNFDSGGNNTTSFSAAGGCMNYYFIYGPKLTTVTERYTRLTGTPEMPPMWALGYHQCRWSYFPESRVKELARKFRDKRIPCDAIYLDIDYMDDYRVFTWNKDRFPDPGQMIADLRKEGFKTVVMIDPGVKVDNEYTVYREGLQNDYFCKRPDGDLMIGPVWPPRTAFPDFTHPEVREWWGDLYKELINEQGVSGFWNDMNEPAVFEVKKKTFPENVRHSYDGQPASHKKAHNIYGMQMARASYEGIKKHHKGKRPFLLTRANFSGGQRYAALWTGDNIANWDHLQLANEQCQRLSISGYSFVGTDIGGFVKDPSAELFTRWLQLSVFHPLFRNHTMGYNVEGAAAVKEEEVELKKKKSNSDQEPWTFGEKYTDINRSVIELRYQLLYYLYTAFYQYVQQGTPILRPLAYRNQTDPESINAIDEFLFGDKILVSPVLEKGKRQVETYFPDGMWYDFRTNKQYKGGDRHSIEAPLAEIPFFIKAGSVLPLREVMQYTNERNPKLLELNLYYSNSETVSHLYEDAGHGYNYQEGEYRYTTFTLQSGKPQTLTLTADRKGSYIPNYKETKVNIVGLPFTPSLVDTDGKQIEFSVSTEDQVDVYSCIIPANFKKLVIKR